MTMFPDRHPQKDFFILDISDIAPKDDLASMEHPLFSLSTKPDMRELEYHNGGNRLYIVPSGKGLPTIFDKDVIIFCISQLMEKKNRGEPIGKRVRFTARELLIATNRPTNNLGYKRLEQAFHRLIGTTFQTDITTGDTRETRFFSMIESGSGFVMKNDGRWRLDYCEVILSDWLFRAVEANEVATISKDYFRLRRPIERRTYEIARKHCANQNRWNISLPNLQQKTGSSAPLKKFRMNIRQISEADHLPFYTIELTKEDLVIFRPRHKKTNYSNMVSIPEWAEEKAKLISLELGWDYQRLRAQWLDFVQTKTMTNEPPKNPGAAFIAYCKKQKPLR